MPAACMQIVQAARRNAESRIESIPYSGIPGIQRLIGARKEHTVQSDQPPLRAALLGGIIEALDRVAQPPDRHLTECDHQLIRETHSAGISRPVITPSTWSGTVSRDCVRGVYPLCPNREVDSAPRSDDCPQRFIATSALIHDWKFS